MHSEHTISPFETSNSTPDLKQIWHNPFKTNQKYLEKLALKDKLIFYLFRHRFNNFQLPARI